MLILGWLLTKLTVKYHERRLIAVSLITYFTLYLIVYSLYIIGVSSTTLSLSIVELELIFTISRLVIIAGAQTYLMKLLTHKVPAESWLFNAPLILTVMETVMKFPPWSFSELYISNYSRSKEIATGYLVIVIGLVMSVMGLYGHLRTRYNRLYNSEDPTYKLLL